MPSPSKTWAETTSRISVPPAAIACPRCRYILYIVCSAVRQPSHRTVGPQSLWESKLTPRWLAAPVQHAIGNVSGTVPEVVAGCNDTDCIAPDLEAVSAAAHEAEAVVVALGLHGRPKIFRYAD